MMRTMMDHTTNVLILKTFRGIYDDIPMIDSLNICVREVLIPLFSVNQ